MPVLYFVDITENKFVCRDILLNKLKALAEKCFRLKAAADADSCLTKKVLMVFHGIGYL
jgi:hypothetical protein